MAEERNPRMNPSFGGNYSQYQQEVRRETQAAQEEQLAAGELWDAVTESEWIAPRLSKQAEFETGGEPAISQERLEKDLGNMYDQTEYDFIAEASSEDDYQARKEKVAQDRELARLIGGEGLRGIGYSMLAGMTDPALLPLYIGTGGGAALGRATLMTKALRSGGLGVAEGAAVEAALSSADTQRDWRDIVLAGATGGVLSSSVTLGASGYSRLRHGKQPTPNQENLNNNPDLAAEANAGDRSLNEMVRDYREQEAIRAMEDSLSIESIRSIDTRQTLIDELAPLAANRMRRGDRQPVEAEQRSLENQLEQLRASRESVEPVGPGGTARQRREASQTRQQRIADIEERMQPVRQRLDEVKRTLDEDLPAREAWADISRLAQGQVPKRYIDRLKQMQEEQVSPMNRNESRRVRELAAEATRRRQEAVDTEVRRPRGEQGEDTQSVGAARATGVRDHQDAYPESGILYVEDTLSRMEQTGREMPDRDKIRSIVGVARGFASPYTQMTASESNIIKGLSHSLLSDPQAATRGHIAAAHRVANNHDRLMAAEGGREKMARDKWAKEMGIRSYRMHLFDEEVVKDFDNGVVLQMRGQDQGSEAIREAAEARRDFLKAALEMRKNAGEPGFENVEHSDAYWSFLPDFHKMQSMVSKHGADEVIELLTGSYMNGRFRLNEGAARMVARATYNRTMQRGLKTGEGGKYALSNTELGSLRADMEEAGVPPNQIDNFLEEIERTKLSEGISDRAKLSLGASMSYTHNGIRMVDVLDTSVNVTNRYGIEAAAGAALARSGLKGRTHMEQTIQEAERIAKNAINEEARERGLSQKETNRRLEAIGRDAKQLEDSLKLMYGESLDAGLGNAVKLSRGARKTTNIVALQWNGFASVGEVSNQLVNMGVGTTLRNTRFKDFASFGSIRKSEDLQGMYKLVGAYGQFGSSVKDNNYTLQTMDEYNQNRVERIFNNAAGWVSNKTQLMSGFRSVQHGLENIALRSMQDRLVRIADGKLKPRQRDFDEMERAGLTRNQIDEVLTHINKNPEYVTVDGEQVRIFSGEGLDPALREDLGVAMTTMLSRNMQRSFVGETPIWMSKEVGKMLTQFRSFGIVSMEKQLAAGLRGDKIGMFLKTMFGISFGMAAYSSRAWVRAQNSENPEEEWDKYMERRNLTMGVVNMAPQLGAASLGMEFGYATGLFNPEGSEASSRTGMRPLTIENAIPAAGVSMQALNSLRNGISGSLQGDGEQAMEGYKDLMGMLPIVNSAAIGSAMAVADKAVE